NRGYAASRYRTSVGDTSTCGIALLITVGKDEEAACKLLVASSAELITTSGHASRDGALQPRRHPSTVRSSGSEGSTRWASRSENVFIEKRASQVLLEQTHRRVRPVKATHSPYRILDSFSFLIREA